MNDLDLCLEVESRSRQPLHYIWRRISRKPLEIEAWFQWSTNRKWRVGYRMVTWPMTSRDLERSNSLTNTLTAQYLENGWRETPFQRTTNRKWHGVSNGHVTTDDVTWPQRCCEAVRSAIPTTAWLLVWTWHRMLTSASKSRFLFRGRTEAPTAWRGLTRSLELTWAANFSGASKPI